MTKRGSSNDSNVHFPAEEQGSHASHESAESKSDSHSESRNSFTKGILKQRKNVTFDLQRNTTKFVEF